MHSTHHSIENSLRRSLRALARNMVLISEGNGSPGELVDEIVEVAESLITYNQSFGTRPPQELIRCALDDLDSEEE